MANPHTLNIATDGFIVTLEHGGSNPLSIGSEYRLGPELQIFSLLLTPDTGIVDFDQNFVGSVNPLLISIPSTAMSAIAGGAGDNLRPFDFRLTIDGVSYSIPASEVSRIKGKNGGRVYWRATQGVGVILDQGFFYFFRHAPSVF
jgi:hypothetical protein